MRFTFEKALGVHEPALHLQSQRSQLLAANLANADTPQYKARDMDFQAALRVAIGEESGPLVRTHSMHLEPDGFDGKTPLFRTPHMPSLDGNTVEEQVEMAAFTENSMRYLTSLRVLGGRFQSLTTAIKGQ